MEYGCSGTTAAPAICHMAGKSTSMRDKLMNSAADGDEISQCRRNAVAFLIESAEKLQPPPIIKYSALTLFADRFFPTITNSNHNHYHFLLHNPLNHATLQLFSLISLWISFKIHGPRRPPLPLTSLKSIGDDRIKDQHFTKSDYLNAEILFLQCLNFDIQAMNNSVFVAVKELLLRFKEAAEMLSFEACMDVMDVVYESEAISRLFVKAPEWLATGILGASFLITVPKQRTEFSLVSWLRFVTGFAEQDITWIVQLLLDHIVKCEINSENETPSF